MDNPWVTLIKRGLLENPSFDGEKEAVWFWFMATGRNY